MATWAELQNEKGEVEVDMEVIPESQKLEGRHKFSVSSLEPTVTKVGDARIVVKGKLQDNERNATVRESLDPDKMSKFYWKTQNFLRSIGGASSFVLDGGKVMVKVGENVIDPTGLTFIADVKTEMNEAGFVNINIKNFYKE